MFIKRKSIVNKPAIISNSNEEKIKVISEQFQKSKSCNQQTILEVNDLLQYMTNFDYVKDMLHDVNKQVNFSPFLYEKFALNMVNQ